MPYLPCCLVGWTADEPLAILHKFVEDMTATALALPDLLDEVVVHRRSYFDANEAFRVTAKSKILPLTWSAGVPADDPARAVRTAARPRGASPVATEALGLVADLRRSIELWQDTEQARLRRGHLRSLGDLQPLPPRWLAALRAAAARREN